MSRANIILGAALVVQLGLVAAMFVGKSDTAIADLEPILDLDASAITKIEIFAKDAKEKNDGAPAIVLDRSSGTWQLASHWSYPATGAKVDELITKLAAMKARGPIATKAATHRKFSVTDDKHERRLIIHQKVGEPIEVYIGGSAGQRQAAIRKKGEEKVYGATGITAWGIATGVTSWIDTAYFKLVGGAASLTIKNEAGEVELRRDAVGSAWKRYAGDAEVVAPEGKELDAPKIAGLGNKLANLQLAEPADPKTALTKAATVHFKAFESDKEHVMTIGAEKDNRHLVRVDELPQVWVSKHAISDFLALKGEELWRDPPKEGDTPPPSAPTGLDQLPPDILRQLQQQGIAPQ